MLETTDVFRGAFLLCKGGRLEEVYVSDLDRRIVAFRIVGEGLAEIEEAYRNGSATVNPLRLRESLNQLRDILFRTLRTDERNKTRGAGYADQSGRDHGDQAGGPAGGGGNGRGNAQAEGHKLGRLVSIPR